MFGRNKETSTTDAHGHIRLSGTAARAKESRRTTRTTSTGSDGKRGLFGRLKGDGGPTLT